MPSEGRTTRGPARRPQTGAMARDFRARSFLGLLLAKLPEAARNSEATCKTGRADKSNS